MSDSVMAAPSSGWKAFTREATARASASMARTRSTFPPIGSAQDRVTSAAASVAASPARRAVATASSATARRAGSCQPLWTYRV
jgi:hypothetical protein